MKHTLILAAVAAMACLGPIGMCTEVAPPPAWLARVEPGIAAHEYRASENGEGLQAPNRAHNLRTYFNHAGIRVHDRTGAESPELLGLTLAGVGRGTTIAAVEPGTAPRANQNRVEIHRPGLVEWYVNSRDGLEQGFTLAERPGGEGRLVVELAVAGARPALTGDAIIFDTGARKLHYGALVANDANGEVLAARFEVPAGDRLRIVVDDARAAYPLVIDPLLTEAADQTLSGGQGGASFGFSVAGAGDVNGDGYADVIIGANGYDDGQTNEGAAFVYHGSPAGITGNTPGTADAQLTSNVAGVAFGITVASAGDVNGDGYADVIVGATGWSSTAGAAFVFHGSATGIVGTTPATAAAQLTSTQANGVFGISVAGAGDLNADGYAEVVVGAWRYDNGQTDEGAAFVFHGSASGVGTRTQLAANVQLESNQGNAAFGVSVAGAGDVNGDGHADLIVGAQWYEIVNPPFTQSTEGAAFVYHGGPGSLVLGATLRGNQPDAWLGRSVASAGDVNGDGYADVIAGAPFFDSTITDEGAAFVFHGGPTGILGSNPGNAATQVVGNQANGQLGNRVAGIGDVNGDGYADVIAASALYDSPSPDEGAAFVYLGRALLGVVSGTPGAAAAQLESNQGSSDYGSGVAGAGDVNGDGYADLIVGASLFDAATSNDGAAFVYRGGGWGVADGNPTTAAAELESTQQNGSWSFGNTVASAGDVNGDGWDDVIVGAPFYHHGELAEGVAFVFHGSAAGIGDQTTENPDALLESNRHAANLGNVAGAGDVNGDGYADVIVGAQFYDNGLGGEGAAFVFLGSTSGVADGNPATANGRIIGDKENAFVGASVDGAGDVNGDGYADVIVGAYGYDNGQPGEGAAFVFYGSASGIGHRTTAAADVRVESNQASAFLGTRVSGAGDVNGDGYADIIIGAPHYDSGELDEGASFVLLGSVSGIASSSPASPWVARLESNEVGARQQDVAEAGDVNGDGFGDVIVGTPGFGPTGWGAAFVYHGSASGIGNGNPATASAVLSADQQMFFGGSVASAGDVNGDGFADVVVGAPLYKGPDDNEGAAFVFLGSASGIADGTQQSASARIEGDQLLAELGTSVAAADVNADGFADLLLGAPGYDWEEPGSNEGGAFVFHGNSAGRAVLTRQRRGDFSNVPVQPWGRSGPDPSFAAELRGSHPAGLGLVRGEFEACPVGISFGHASCATALSPSWEVVGPFAPDLMLPQTLTGFANNTVHRWRARVLHAPVTGVIPPVPAHGPWRRHQAQTREADIRLPEPGMLGSFAAGLVLVSGLARRRRPVR